MARRLFCTDVQWDSNVSIAMNSILTIPVEGNKIVWNVACCFVYIFDYSISWTTYKCSDITRHFTGVVFHEPPRISYSSCRNDWLHDGQRPMVEDVFGSCPRDVDVCNGAILTLTEYIFPSNVTTSSKPIDSIFGYRDV